MEPRPPTRTTSILIGLALLLAAGACSSGSDSSDGSTAASGASTTAPPSLTPRSKVDSGTPATAFELTSPGFTNGGDIPKTFSCQGAGTQPALKWTGVPAGSKSLTLVVFDPDAGSSGFVHWVIGGIDPATGGIAQDTVPAGAVQANNGAGQPKWTGPCPPSGKHRYVFSLYALNVPTNLTAGQDATAAIDATKAKATATTTLTGLYEKS